METEIVPIKGWDREMKLWAVFRERDGELMTRGLERVAGIVNLYMKEDSAKFYKGKDEVIKQVLIKLI